MSRDASANVTDSSQPNMDKETSYFPVTLAEDIRIPPRSEVITAGNLACTSNDSVIIIEPVDICVSGVSSARVVCRNYDTVPVRLMNVKRTAVVLKAHSVVGHAYQTCDQATTRPTTSSRAKPARLATVRNISQKEREDVVNQIDITHLQGAAKEKLHALLIEYADIFRGKNGKLGCTPSVQHRIITENELPIAKRPYQVPFGQREILKKEIDKLLQGDIISHSSSPWSAPVVMVKKKHHEGEEAEVRLCIDYRGLNAITKTDFFPLPLIRDTLEQMSGAELFSTVDLASGYFQIELAEADREKSAFSTPDNHYQFNRMPMGLKNSSASWQRLMNAVLSGLTGDHCLVFLDDIIIYSSSDADKHLDNLRSVFARLRENNLTLKPTKCKFLQKQAAYLGHILDSQGCRTDPAKTRAIQAYPRPRSVKDIRSFLGLCGFYRRFVPKFSEIAQPLTQLTKKGVPFVWTDTQTESFDSLKLMLTTPPVLKYPDFSRPFALTTDASGIAVSGILSQKYNGFEHPIAYTSRILNTAERNYSAIELELTAVIHSVKHFRCYLAGSHFTLITDHAPLRYLLRLKDPSSRLARWALTLMEYDFEVVHRPGRMNQNADCLSRVIIPDDNEKEFDAVRHIAANELETADIIPDIPFIWSRENISAAQFKDPELLKIISSVKKESNVTHYLTTDNILYRTRTFNERQDKLLVPTDMKNDIMKLYHESPIAAHVGYSKTLHLIKQLYEWKHMAAQIKRYCEECISCNRQKSGPRTNATLQQLPIPDGVCGLVSIDIVGPLNRTRSGNKYMLTCMDYLTRYAECIPMPDIHAKTVAKAFATQYITRHGVPIKLLSDQGTQFLSKLFKELCKLLRIEKLQTTPYRPQCNGAIERFHRSLKTMLSHYLTEEENSWDEYLPFIMMAYRNTVHKATNETPFFLLHGRDMSLPFHTTITQEPASYELPENYAYNLVQRMNDAHQLAAKHLGDRAVKQSIESTKRARNREYHIGDRVYLHTTATAVHNLSRKFAPKWNGPYRIIQAMGPVTYKIKLMGGRKTQVVHVNRLKPCKGNKTKEEKLKQSESDESDSDNNNFEYCDSARIKTFMQRHHTRPGGGEIDGGAPSESERDGLTTTKVVLLDDSAVTGNEADTALSDPTLEDGTGDSESSELTLPPTTPQPAHHTRSQGPVTDLPWVCSNRS